MSFSLFFVGQYAIPKKGLRVDRVGLGLGFTLLIPVDVIDDINSYKDTLPYDE